MNSYVIPSLTDGQIKLLREAGIEHHLFDSQNGYIVSGSDLAAALELLQCTASEAPTEFAQVMQLTLTYFTVPESKVVVAQDTNVSVDLNGNDMPSPEFIALIDSLLSPQVGRKIVLHLPPRIERVKRTRPIIQDEAFHVHIGSSPSGKRKTSPPRQLWGHTVEHFDKCFGLTGQGIPLMDSEAEFAVGELFENNLYIHVDLVTSQQSASFQLLGTILNKALPDLNLRGAAFRQRMKERQSAGRSKSRQAYITACSQRVRELAGAYKDALRKRKKKLATMQQALLGLLRLDNFGGKVVPAADRQAEFSAEYQRLKDVSRVKEITVSSTLVMLKTEMLHAQHFDTGQLHEIGEFLIVIDLHGGKNPVRWFNSTRRVDGMRPGMHSPTVYADGSPMVDEIQETIIELIARLELSIVAELAIQFIETVNKDLPGATLVNWPLARQQG